MRPTVAAILAMAAAAGGAGGQVRTGGWIEYQAIAYRTGLADLPVVGRDQLRFQPEVEGRFGSHVRLFAAVELRGDAADPGRNRAYLDEGYADLFVGPLDVRLGRQILAWGRADAVNPTDFFGARDFTDVLDADEEKVAQVAVRGAWFVGRWSVEVVAAPRFTESLLPVPGSRWWPTGDAGAPGSSPRAVLDGAGGPPDGRTAWGVRASGSAAGMDMAVSGYRGPWHLPVLLAGAVRPDPSTGEPVVRVVPSYYRLSALGADVATVLGPVGLHAEAAVYVTGDRGGTDPGTEDSFARYVVGGDYTVRGALFGRDVFLLAEWIQDVRLTSDGAPWSPQDLNHVLGHSLFLRASVPLGDFSGLDLQGLYDPARRDWVLQLEPRWKPRDRLEVRLSADLPGGPPDSFFGAFRDDRRLHVRVRFSF